uniref:SGNH hydrolase-type esterase domain-containing protein n=1 Tax=Parascaris univalens TaxID=6257 RepID=A0A915AYD0_PARUN
MKVNDRWIVAVGDSFASGEGNPDVPTSLPETKLAQWISERCHRSARSWAFKVYEKIRDTTSTDVALHFTYLPCTGASVDNGIVVSTTGISQLDIVRQIAQIRKSGPDLVLMSAGGNDIGYSEILSTLIWGESNSLFASVDMRFFYASYQLDRIAAILQKIKPNQVVIPHYFDVTRNERGVIDADCAELRQVCAEYIISVRDSIRLQGNSMGAFHPTEEAHQIIAELIWQQLEHSNH